MTTPKDAKPKPTYDQLVAENKKLKSENARLKKEAAEMFRLLNGGG